MRWGSRSDDNQAALVAHWRALGGSWFSTHRLPGELDGVAGCCGIDVRVEIKDGDKPPSRQRLTDREEATWGAWRGREPVMWTCLEDVERTFRRLRREGNEIKRHFDQMRQERKSLEDTLSGITVEELRREASDG